MSHEPLRSTNLFGEVRDGEVFRVRDLGRHVVPRIRTRRDITESTIKYLACLG